MHTSVGIDPDGELNQYGTSTPRSEGWPRRPGLPVSRSFFLRCLRVLCAPLSALPWIRHTIVTIVDLIMPQSAGRPNQEVEYLQCS